MRVVLVALALSLTAGCFQVPLCGRGMRVGHPTMTADDVSVGNEGRVRSVAESGAQAGPTFR